MWLFALFDLPVDTKSHRRAYTKFRKTLLGEGFSMLQFSVYARYCVGEESSEAFRRRVRKELPTDGQVRLMAVTDRQFGKMEIFFGKNLLAAETPPDQLLLF
jgi:CRISPR-associated protein Cas2